MRPNTFQPHTFVLSFFFLSLSLSPSVSHTIIARAAAAVVVWCKQALGTNIPLFINVLMWGKIILFLLLLLYIPPSKLLPKSGPQATLSRIRSAKDTRRLACRFQVINWLGPTHTHTPIKWLTHISTRRSGVVYSAVIPWHVALAI